MFFLQTQISSIRFNIRISRILYIIIILYYILLYFILLYYIIIYIIIIIYSIIYYYSTALTLVFGSPNYSETLKNIPRYYTLSPPKRYIFGNIF